MIDLHTHVLWGLDDGPATIEDSVALARAASRSGTRTLAATPHLRHDFPDVAVDELAGRCETLNERLRVDGVPLEVVSGGEVDFEWARAATPGELERASYGGRGRDLLLETPYGPITPAFEAAVFRLASLGLRVLLAHPERNPTFQDSPDRLKELVRRGALVQLTAQSLMSGRRRRPAYVRLAFALLEGGLAHVIASDAHGADSGRPVDLSEAVAAAGSVARGRGEWMVTDAPAAILAGERLSTAPPDAGRRPRWWPRPRGHALS